MKDMTMKLLKNILLTSVAALSAQSFAETAEDPVKLLNEHMSTLSLVNTCKTYADVTGIRFDDKGTLDNVYSQLSLIVNKMDNTVSGASELSETEVKHYHKLTTRKLVLGYKQKGESVFTDKLTVDAKLLGLTPSTDNCSDYVRKAQDMITSYNG